MPTEFVYSKSGKFDFEIRWDAEEGRDSEIQIGISTHHGEKTLADALSPEPLYAQLTEAPPKPETPEQIASRKLEAFEHYRGIYGQFDRASLNRMIRLLRKARDHVYGRDE